MFKPNLRKAVVLGLCMAFLSTNLAFAQERMEQEESIKGEIAADETAVMTLMDGVDAAAPDAGVSIANTGTGEGVTGFEGNAASDVAVPPVEEPVYDTADTAVDAENELDPNLAVRSDVNPDQAVSPDDELKIQITSTGAEIAVEADEANLREIAAESAPIAEDDVYENSVYPSLIILAVAGGAVLVGGGLLLAKRKETDNK